jgi:glycosyltransferase involved in cell wall biosynthesis
MNSQKKDSVSITGIVPCFNASETLREVITSLYNQNPPLEEIIVIDDGSTDASSSIAKDMKC